MKTHTEIIETALSQINWQQEPYGLYEPIAYTLSSGGKRIRPALVLLGCKLFGGKAEEALPAALAVEVFHNFTLLHDDLMDKADLRRNRPTVHQKWNDNTAILSGDVMQIKAYQLLSQVPEKHLKSVLDLFSTMACEICEGQQYDMDFETREDVSAQEYLEMIRLKTAVLLGTALKIGALIGGADAESQNLLYDFGINIGLAFQLKDDLLDVYGNSDTFGKKIGGDILCNKKTFLLISALQCAEIDIKSELLRWINAKKYNPNEKISAVTNIYNLLKIKELSEDKMDFYYQKALTSLKKIDKNNENWKELHNLATSLMKREI
ncbi:MAG: polyprenyl synthetase family protein [Prevotellaceae bacterium]|jgi:geranylgeranyl diphosphate synthase type II|nr:polyprenyl synthetase family protein [Prevotellaceae bacterium]